VASILHLSLAFFLEVSPVDWLHFLQHQLLKIGPLSITPIFLMKACLFVFLLVTTSRIMQRVLLSRLFRHLPIAEAQKFALGRFITYLFFLAGLFIGLQSLGVNLNSLVVFWGSRWRRRGSWIAKCRIKLRRWAHSFD